jgi:hypothetical protein
MDIEKKNIATEADLKPILAILNQEEAQEILLLRNNLIDNWRKKQIFRTDTEMRISVLNDASFPTPAAKYWQAVRETSAMFDSLMTLSFELRRNEVRRLRAVRTLKEATQSGDELDILEAQVNVEEATYVKAQMEQIARDRVRELKTWDKIKAELDDGSFDTENVNTHQAVSLAKALQNRVDAMNEHTAPSEVINALGPLKTVERLIQGDKLMDFKEARAHFLDNK